MEWMIQPWAGVAPSDESSVPLLDYLVPGQTVLVDGVDIHVEDGSASVIPAVFANSLSSADMLLSVTGTDLEHLNLIVFRLVRALVAALGQPVLELGSLGKAAARKSEVDAFVDQLISSQVVKYHPQGFTAKLDADTTLDSTLRLLLGSNHDYLLRFGGLSFTDHDAQVLFLGGDSDSVASALSCLKQAAYEAGVRLREVALS